MMQASLSRFDQDAFSTLGKLTLPDASTCFILERAALGDHHRIPAGGYSLGLKKVGTSKFDPTAIEMFGNLHHGMIEILDVPGRTDILIHWGNSAVDSEGCLLTGENHSMSNVGSHGGKPTFWVGQSRHAYQIAYPKISDAIRDGGAFITIEDVPDAPLVA